MALSVSVSVNAKFEISRLALAVSGSIIRISPLGRSFRGVNFNPRLSRAAFLRYPRIYLINRGPLSFDSKDFIQPSDILAKSLRAVTHGRPCNSLKKDNFKSLRAVTYRNSPRKSLRAVTYEKHGGRGSLGSSNSYFEFSPGTLQPGIATHRKRGCSWPQP
jgi:hypothetical protein